MFAVGVSSVRTYYFAAKAITAGNPSGLTSEQRAWLVAVTRGNATLPWPPLSANQSLQLQQSVEAYQQITEGPNHPYNQAGKLDD